MQVNVQLFAGARQRAGCASLSVDVPEPATAAALKQALAARVPELAPLLPGLRIAVNLEFAPDDAVIPPGAEVAVIPPVSGGGPSPAEFTP